MEKKPVVLKSTEDSGAEKLTGYQKNPWDVRVNLRYNRDILATCEEIAPLLGLDKSCASSSVFWWELLARAEAFARIRGEEREKVKDSIKRFGFDRQELFF